MRDIIVTFGIPAYNAEKYIGDILDCFEKDTNNIFEIMIVDDGSEDKTYEICKKYNYKNLSVYRKKNGGVSSARNFIIEKAKGEWVTFIDADDLISLDSYISKAIEITNCDYDYCINVRNEKLLGKYKNKHTKAMLSTLIEKEILNYPVDKFYRIDILKRYNIRFDEHYSLGEDLLFNLEYLKYAQKIDFYYGKYYFIRRINNNSLTRKFTPNKYKQLIELNSRCKKCVTEKKFKKSLEYIRTKNCISCIKDTFLFPDKFKSPKSYISKIKDEQRMQYVLLNNAKTTIIHLAFHLCPTVLVKYLVFAINIKKIRYKG